MNGIGEFPSCETRSELVATIRRKTAQFTVSRLIIGSHHRAVVHRWSTMSPWSLWIVLDCISAGSLHHDVIQALSFVGCRSLNPRWWLSQRKWDALIVLEARMDTEVSQIADAARTRVG